MKKVLSIALVLVMVLALSACGQSAAPSQDGGQSASAPAQSGNAPAQSGNAPAQSGNTPAQSGNTPAQGASDPSQGGSSAPADNTPKAEYTGQPITLKIATHANDGDVKYDICYKIAEALETRSGGLITCQVYPSAQLIEQKSAVETIPAGVADIGVVTLGPWSGVVPEISILGAMGLFPSQEQFFAACEEEGGYYDYLNQLFDQNANTQVLSWLYIGGSDCLVSSKGQIKTPADFNGLKFRSPTAAMGAAISALGAAPVTIPAGDMYTSLQTGVVDGTWANTQTVLQYNLPDVCKYISQLPLAYNDAAAIVVGNVIWDSWSDELKALVTDICADMYAFSFQFNEDQVDSLWASWEADPNLSVYHIPQEDVAAFSEIIAPNVLKTYQDTLSEASYSHIVEIMNRHQ